MADYWNLISQTSIIPMAGTKPTTLLCTRMVEPSSINGGLLCGNRWNLPFGVYLNCPFVLCFRTSPYMPDVS